MKKSNTIFLLPLLFTLLISIICMSGREVHADIGAKPSIKLKIANAPQNYYIALLTNWKDVEGENSELRFDNVNDTNIESQLKEFKYDGWSYHETPVGSSFYTSNAEDEYIFSYMVPDPFRVILVNTDGTVYLSEEMNQEEYNTECTYDVSTGVVTEERSGKIAMRVINVIVCYILTLAVELLFLFFFKYPFSRRNLLIVLLVNTLTNLPLNIILANGDALLVFVITILGEIVIILLEGLIYTFTLKDKEDEIKRLRNFIYGVVANVVSAILSFVAHLIFLMLFG